MHNERDLIKFVEFDKYKDLIKKQFGEIVL